MSVLPLSSESVLIPPIVSKIDTQEVVPTPFPHELSNKSQYEILKRYEIIKKQQSESAWIFFTFDPSTLKPLVMKVLRPYRDSRYDLSGTDKRLKCQREALQQNRLFTPEVYIGLAHLYNQPDLEDYILTGNIIENPADAEFEPDAEYALIMERLPDERRLDQLLKGSDDEVQELVSTITSYVAYLHTYGLPSLPEKEGICWGNYERLKGKLEENIAFCQLLLDKFNSTAFEAMIRELITGLREVFTKEHFGDYLKQRVESGYIKRCHGDIKALNTWILNSTNDAHLEQTSVKLLDAIDFNPLFCNIDILSDFAMLVVDVQARRPSPQLASNMIDSYLRLTYQDNKEAQSLLTFYITEKATIAATINILFDNEFELGQRLLELALVNLKHLAQYWRYQLL